MVAVGSIIDLIVGESLSRSREHLGPSRITPAARNENDLGRSLTIRENVGSLRNRLVRVRDAARRLVSDDARSVVRLPQAARVSSSRVAAVAAEAVVGTTRSRPAAFRVKVTRRARAQLNQGQTLAKEDRNGIHAGINRLSIRIGGGPSITVAFTNDSTDTNGRAVEKLTQAINRAATGVTARAVTDEAAGTVRVDLTADATGTARAFTITDLSGNAVAATGIGAVTTEAANARFVVNGVARTAASNEVLIDDGRVRLALTAETGPNGNDDEVGALISVEPDPLTQGVLDLADSLNDLQEALTAGQSANVLGIRARFAAVLAEQRAKLGAIGVAVDAEGRVVVDGERLAAAIAGDRASVINVVGAADGVGARVSAAAEEALRVSVVRVLQESLLARQVIRLPAVIDSAEAAERGLLVDILG